MPVCVPSDDDDDDDYTICAMWCAEARMLCAENVE